jgi:predicted RNA binding protein YcfA (HicA-like mRNA interferase family)
MRKKVFEIIKIIEADGWYFDRQKGSHMQYRHPTKKGTVTIPNHGRNYELDHEVVNSILKQAGLK